MGRNIHVYRLSFIVYRLSFIKQLNTIRLTLVLQTKSMHQSDLVAFTALLFCFLKSSGVGS